jgi:hypothetical protein
MALGDALGGHGIQLTQHTSSHTYHASRENLLRIRDYFIELDLLTPLLEAGGFSSDAAKEASSRC